MEASNLTNFRSRPDGSHYPISKRKSVGSRQTRVVHLGVKRRINGNSITLKPSGQYSEEVYHKKHLIGSVRKLDANEYLAVGMGQGNYSTHKTQQEAIQSLIDYRKQTIKSNRIESKNIARSNIPLGINREVKKQIKKLTPQQMDFMAKHWASIYNLSIMKSSEEKYVKSQNFGIFADPDSSGTILKNTTVVRLAQHGSLGTSEKFCLPSGKEIQGWDVSFKKLTLTPLTTGKYEEDQNLQEFLRQNYYTWSE